MWKSSAALWPIRTWNYIHFCSNPRPDTPLALFASPRTYAGSARPVSCHPACRTYANDQRIICVVFPIEKNVGASSSFIIGHFCYDLNSFPKRDLQHTWRKKDVVHSPCFNLNLRRSDSSSLHLCPDLRRTLIHRIQQVPFLEFQYMSVFWKPVEFRPRNEAAGRVQNARSKNRIDMKAHTHTGT